MVVTAQDDDKFTCAPGTHAVVNSAPDADPVAPDVFRVTWHTTVSNTPVVIEVVRAWSPVGVDRFHQLIRDNFFDCSAFFRVVPGTCRWLLQIDRIIRCDTVDQRTA